MNALYRQLITIVLVVFAGCTPKKEPIIGKWEVIIPSEVPIGASYIEFKENGILSQYVKAKVNGYETILKYEGTWKQKGKSYYFTFTKGTVTYKGATHVCSQSKIDRENSRTRKFDVFVQLKDNDSLLWFLNGIKHTETKRLKQ